MGQENTLLSSIAPHMCESDDANLWLCVLNIACKDMSSQVEKSQTKRDVFLVVGPCSSWLRPHQTRWHVGNEEFAWPSGYGGSRHSRTGLPELDWCCCFQYSGNNKYTFVPAPRQFKKRQIVLRVAIPTQTTARSKASINMLWTPCLPQALRESVVRIMAMRRGDKGWSHLDSLYQDGDLWRGEILPPPRKRIQPHGGTAE